MYLRGKITHRESAVNFLYCDKDFFLCIENTIMIERTIEG